jgi:opacity protein-like surface antigen
MPITNSMSRSDDFDVLASARARVGTLFWGNTLIYGTGGLAWTRFRSTLNQTQNLFGVGGAGADLDRSCDSPPSGVSVG